MIDRRVLYSIFNSANTHFIVQKIIDKLDYGLYQSRQQILSFFLRREIRVDIDRAFEEIYTVNKIAGMIKKIKNQELLQKATLLYSDYNIKQFLEDIENLINLRVGKIHNSYYVLNTMDEFLKYLSVDRYSIRRTLRGEINYGIYKGLNDEIAAYSLEGIKYIELKQDEDAIRELISGRSKDLKKEVELIKKIIKEKWFKKDEIYHICHKKSIELFEKEMNKKKDGLERRRLEIKKLEDGITNKEEELKEVIKTHCLIKQYVEPLDQENIKKYQQCKNLREVLLKLSTSGLQHLERYYKFKKYEKYLSDRIQLYQSIPQELFMMEDELCSIGLI